MCAGEPSGGTAGHADAHDDGASSGFRNIDASGDVVDVPMRTFDGVSVERLRTELHVPELHLFASTASTLDVAHRLGASGAPHGALVLADRQTAGRGRGGKSWSSPPGTGLWITILARPVTTVPPVMTVRLGLAAARVLDLFALAPVQVKWPNDLYVGGRKLGGVLVEARWRGTSLEWVAIGIGINVTVPGHAARGGALGAHAGRASVLRALMPSLRAAFDRTEPILDAGEVADYEVRDLARDRACVKPVHGIVRGITAGAELIIATNTGMVTVHAGSLTLSEEV